jgi:hypothetical protein
MFCFWFKLFDLLNYYSYTFFVVYHNYNFMYSDIDLYLHFPYGTGTTKIIILYLFEIY